MLLVSFCLSLAYCYLAESWRDWALYTHFEDGEVIAKHLAEPKPARQIREKDSNPCYKSRGKVNAH